ncbi:hypothetical protein F4820DRAFT_51967 [Hypoxylon rubiginosum]|uniref:Uncharacterized protein n=1 Tax=Hypoxylon rubiginosum TaxID=110542 RepID=A0ACB9YQT1_9PEZI|nr:hypothetical protein F4820DRAFT_51967 [Hypoxylon rubiginosum]
MLPRLHTRRMLHAIVALFPGLPLYKLSETAYIASCKGTITKAAMHLLGQLLNQPHATKNLLPNKSPVLVPSGSQPSNPCPMLATLSRTRILAAPSSRHLSCTLPSNPCERLGIICGWGSRLWTPSALQDTAALTASN